MYRVSGNPELVLHRVHEAVELVGVMLERRTTPQTGFGQALSVLRRAITCTCSCGTALPKRRDIELVALGHLLERAATRAISLINCACSTSSRSMISTIAGAARNQQQPGIIGVVDDQHARQRQSPSASCRVRSCGCSDQAGDRIFMRKPEGSQDLHRSIRRPARLLSRSRPDISSGGWRWTSHSPTGSGPEGSSPNELRFGSLVSLPPYLFCAMCGPRRPAPTILKRRRKHDERRQEPFAREFQSGSRRPPRISPLIACWRANTGPPPSTI